VEVAGGWRGLHNEELHNVYASAIIIGVINSRRMRWAWHVVCMGAVRNACTILVVKPKVKRPLERPRGRWVENISMGLIDIEWECVD
jgi:hypothetical protein